MKGTKQIIGVIGMAAMFDPVNRVRVIDDIREEKQERLESKFIGSLRQKKGHRMYKYNYSTGRLFELTDEDFYDPEIQIVEHFKPVRLVDKLGNETTIAKEKGKFLKKDTRVRTVEKRKIRIEPDTHYFSALNEGNAIKYINKHFSR